MASKRVPSHIRKICDLLKNLHSEYQCAAAMVLGELKVKDQYVVRSLGEVLTNGNNQVLKGHILDAFEKIRSKESLQYLLPFLFARETNDPEFSNRAITIASSLGTESARELKSMLKKASTQERCVINYVFIKMHTLEGLRVILESLQNEEEVVVDEICRLMKEEMKSLTTEERKVFSTKVEAFLKDKRSGKSRRTLSAAIKILGYIGCPDSHNTLLTFSTLQNHPFIRSQALKALKDISLHSAPNQVEVIKKLVSYLEESDFSNIVSPTMDILMRIPFPTRMSDLVIKLLNNQHDAVRRFAIKKMRELNSPKVVRVLVDRLSGQDPAIRDLAAESLCWLDSARTILLEKLLQEKDLDLCCMYTKILKPHATKFRPNQIKRLSDHLNKLMDEDSRLQEPILFLIKTVAPDFLHESLVGRGRKFKQKKNFEQAVRTLKTLQMNGHLGADAKYELAVCQLNLSSKPRNRSARESDPCLPLFQQLVKEEDFPLLEKLKNEKHVDKESLYYIASHLMEKLQKERAVGSDLLKLIIKKHPRSKAGIASRKLLKEAAL